MDGHSSCPAALGESAGGSSGDSEDMLFRSPASPVTPPKMAAPALRMAGLAVGVHFLLAGCAATPAPSGSQMVVTSPAEFYRNGPAQDTRFAFDQATAVVGASGPDFQLASGARVTVVQREFGFSKVRTEGGDVGYVANEQLRLAPVIARAAPLLETRKPRASQPRRRSAPSSRPPVEQLDLSDIPLPLPS